MKKIFVTLLAVGVVSGLLAGCGNNDNDNNSSSSSNTSSNPSSSMTSSGELSTTLKAGTTLQSIYEAIDTEFGEYGAVTMPADLDEQTLVDQYGLDPADVEDYYGKYSMSMTNSDVLVAVKAAPGKVEKVREALEKRKADLEAQYEQYPVNGSYERAKAAKVYTRGDYVFLIGVGAMPQDPDADPEFEKQVGRVQEIIDSLFE